VRVLHVMESTIGGTRRHLVDVCKAQAERGLDVHVCAAALRQPDFEQDLRDMAARGCAVHPLPMVRSIRPATDWRHLRRLKALVRATRPDVVHTHSSKAGVLGRLASIQCGIGARVHTPHTFAFLFEAMFSGPKRRLFRTIETRLARRTDAIIAVSQSEGESFARSGVVPPSRIRVVPNGIDTAPWSAAEPLARAELGATGGAPLAIVVGLLNVAKGQDVLLRALAACERRELELCIVGHGETESELRALARDLGLAERVHFLGFRTDVPRLMKTADFLCLPSRWEGLPYVVLEAFAAGRPVVATDVSGARDLVDEATGCRVAVDDVPALARALSELAALGADERARLGRRGAALVEERYSTAAMVAGLGRVYEEVA